VLAQEPHHTRGMRACQWKEYISKFWTYLTNVQYVPLWWLDRRQSCNLAPATHGLPVRFATHKQPVSSNFLYQSLTVLSVGGSVRYLVRKPRCTVAIDWVLTNCRTQKAFCSPENAMFAHHCLLAEKRVTTPSHLSRKNFYISSIRWYAFISYMWVCYCTAKPLNPGWTYETRCIWGWINVLFLTLYWQELKHIVVIN
jgi:hypothetical protein